MDVRREEKIEVFLFSNLTSSELESLYLVSQTVDVTERSFHLLELCVSSGLPYLDN